MHLSSKQKATAAFRQGFHATVYDVQRDPSLNNKEIIRDKNVKVFPFVAGSHYRGEWNADQKEGFGTQINCDGSKYEGEWKNSKYEGKGTMWLKKKAKSIRQYTGDWSNGHMHGCGHFFYENGEIYRGNWFEGKRSGNGRLDYPNGDYYLGEWLNDTRHGVGSFYAKNGNIFTGVWMNDLKEGPGKYFYASTKKVYEGEWANNQPCCGEYREPLSDEVQQFGISSVRIEVYNLPELAVANPKVILDSAVADVRLSNAGRRGIGSDNYVLSPDVIDLARNSFNMLDYNSTGVVSIYALGGVFSELGLSLTPDDMKDILADLDLDGTADISFPEVCDIAVFLYSAM